MAQACTLPVSSVSGFEFIDCASISVNYEINGMATVGFTVVSTSKTISVAEYSDVTFGANGGGRSTGSFSAGSVRFQGYITSYELNPVAGTLVYEHRISLIAFGCRT
jgi:hypothetical protein